LAFHPYPQLIPIFFNRNGFGPPLGVTRASSWPWVDRIGFGSTPSDSIRPWRLAFATAPRLKRLTSPLRSNSPDHNAKGTQSEDVRRRFLLPLVGTRFQDLFHSPSGVLFTFPSRYWFTIGHGRVCSLGGWSPQLPTGFLVPRRTQGPKPQIQVVFRLQDSHLVSWSVPAHFDYTPGTRGRNAPLGPYNPEVQAPRFGLLPVRSPLLGESRLISLPGATEMFQFTPLASNSLCVQEPMTALCRLPGFPIRASPDQRMRAPPRRFSQLTTPFLACPCLGILRAPLYA
jgi:hypothetical protein